MKKLLSAAKKSKAALALAHQTVTITGDYTNEVAKFSSLNQSFSITYDANNNVLVNGTNNRITTLEDTSWRTIDTDIVVSDTTVSNTTTETTIYSTTISANELQVGSILETVISGLYSTANASDTFNVNIYLNGTLLNSFTSVPKNVTDTPVELKNTMTVRTTGASGAAVARSSFHAENDGLHGTDYSSFSINTTSSVTLSIKMQWSSADVSNSGTITQGFTRRLK